MASVHTGPRGNRRVTVEFDRLVEVTQEELIRFAFYHLGHRDDAEDVVQDVYVEGCRRR